MMPSAWPSGTSNDTSSVTFRAPKLFDTFCRASMVMAGSFRERMQDK